MNEEIKTNEMMEQESENYETEGSTSNGGRGGAGVIGAVLAVGGLAVYAWKNRDKIKQKRINKKIAKMESLGYTVTKNEEPSEAVEEKDSNEEESSEE